jgi:hypothetical protein
VWCGEGSGGRGFTASGSSPHTKGWGKGRKGRRGHARCCTTAYPFGDTPVTTRTPRISKKFGTVPVPVWSRVMSTGIKSRDQGKSLLHGAAPSRESEAISTTSAHETLHVLNMSQYNPATCLNTTPQYNPANVSVQSRRGGPSSPEQLYRMYSVVPFFQRRHVNQSSSVASWEKNWRCNHASHDRRDCTY